MYVLHVCGEKGISLCLAEFIVLIPILDARLANFHKFPINQYDTFNRGVGILQLLRTLSLCILLKSWPRAFIFLLQCDILSHNFFKALATTSPTHFHPKSHTFSTMAFKFLPAIMLLACDVNAINLNFLRGVSTIHIISLLSIHCNRNLCTDETHSNILANLSISVIGHQEGDC